MTGRVQQSPNPGFVARIARSRNAVLASCTAVFVIALLTLPASALAVARGTSDGVIVALERSATVEQVSAAIAAVSAKIEHSVPGARTLLLRGASGADDASLASKLSVMPGVRYAEVNGRVRALAIPNDPSYSQQWGLPAVNAPAAWDLARGSAEVTVAVVDTGVWASHPDLAGAVDTADGWDFVNNDADASDDAGHGTHVSGILAAVTDNNVGVASLAGFGPPGHAGGVTILPVKVLAADGSGSYADVALGIRWAADHGARVINLSLGGSASSTMAEAIAYARAAGCFIAAAAGNDGDNTVSYPAGYEGVVGVAAIDSNLRKASYSNTGSHVDIAAPGTSVYSTIWSSGSGGALYDTLDGTSMATPFVSAAAALLFSAGPRLTAVQVENILTSSARDAGSVGRDDSYGAGILDAAAAVAKAGLLPPITSATLTPDGWTSSDVTVTLSAAPGSADVAAMYVAVGTDPTELYVEPVKSDDRGRRSRAILVGGHGGEYRDREDGLVSDRQNRAHGADDRPVDVFEQSLNHAQRR